MQYASDAANSGTLAVLDGSGPLATLQSLLSFDNVQSLNAFGACGTFVADASSAPAAAKSSRLAMARPAATR